MEGNDQLRRLEAELADLRARMPAHSVRPNMVMRLEELEEEIAQLKKKLSREGNDNVQGAS